MRYGPQSERIRRQLDMKKANLIGVSTGGMIAQHFAADYPKNVGNLVLAATCAEPNHILNESIFEWVELAKYGDHTLSWTTMRSACIPQPIPESTSGSLRSWACSQSQSPSSASSFKPMSAGRIAHQTALLQLLLQLLSSAASKTSRLAGMSHRKSPRPFHMHVVKCTKNGNMVCTKKRRILTRLYWVFFVKNNLMREHNMNHCDDPDFFTAYAQMSRSQQGLPGAGEWHQLESLFLVLAGKDALVLGCGHGWHCKYAADQGTANVLGIDMSEKMIAEAVKRNAADCITYRVCSLLDYNYPANTYDLVISNLVLHYVGDLDVFYRRVYDTPRPRDVFLMNIEQPTFTAGVHQHFSADGTWPVDNYYYPRERQTDFLWHTITKYHHTLTQILMNLIHAGFHLDTVEEAMPLVRASRSITAAICYGLFVSYLPSGKPLSNTQLLPLRHFTF